MICRWGRSKKVCFSANEVAVIFIYLFIYFLVWTLLLTLCSSRGLLLHFNTPNDTHKLVRTPLDEWSGRRRDFYLTKHNIHNRDRPTSPAGFEPAIPATERPQTHSLYWRPSESALIFLRKRDSINFQFSSTTHQVSLPYSEEKREFWETAFITS